MGSNINQSGERASIQGLLKLFKYIFILNYIIFNQLSKQTYLKIQKGDAFFIDIYFCKLR